MSSASSPDGPSIDDVEPPLPPVTPARWPLWLFLLALLGGAGYLGWSLMRVTDPRTILVAIDLDGHWFEGSMAAAELADSVNGGLEALGFTPVRPGDPEVLATLEGKGGDLGAAARALGAGFVVTGRIDVQTLEHPVGDGFHELRGQGSITVFHVDDDPETHTASGDIRGWAGAPKRERGVKLLASGSLSRLILGEALPRLLGHPIIAEKLEADAVTVSALRKASDFVAARTRALREADEAYERYGERRILSEKGPVKVTHHGTTADDDILCGAGAAGLCVKTESTRPYFSPRKLKLRMLEELETIEWRPAGEGEAVVRWQGYNVPGYPRVAPDGRSMAFVEDIFGWAKAPSLIPAEGEPIRLLVDPKRRFTQPQPAPGAKAVAMFVQAERRAPRGLLVLDTAGETLLELPPFGGSFDGFVWLDTEHLIVLQSPRPPEGDGEDEQAEAEAPGPAMAPYVAATAQTVWKVPVDGSPPSALYVTAHERLQWMRRSSDGRALAFERRVLDGADTDGEVPGPGLAVLDLSTEPASLRAIPLPRSLEAPAFSPDARWLTFEYHPPGSRDEEVAVIDLQAADPAASLKVLTDNRVRDRYPVFGADGKRIFFEQLGDDPNDSRRSVSLIASVPAP